MAEAGLELPIGLTEQKFMQQLARIEARSIRSAKRAEDAFAKANGGITSSTRRAADGATRSLGNIGNAATGAVGKVLALALALGKLTMNAQSYTAIENRLRALGQTSDDAVEKLAGAALRSRAPLEEMAGTVSRIQKATGDGYDETIRRVETLNKLMALGGATAAETSSVVVQLSQALSSGSLQGDELRSLREAAPVELLDAIAKAAGSTRAELKDLGADGKLTSDIVVQAIDSMAASTDAQFGQMTMTVGQAFTNMNTGLTLFAGRLDEGLGATDDMSNAMERFGTWLTNNADYAEELGRSISAAMKTGVELANEAEAAMLTLADTIYAELVQGSILDLGAAFSESGGESVDVVDTIINAIATLNGVIEGAAAAAREAFLQIPDAVSAGMEGAINAVISGVESMINTVLEGVRTVASAVDTLTSKIPGTEGTNLAGGVGNVKFGRVTGLATNLSSQSIGDAYEGGFEKGRDSVTGFVDGVKETYQSKRAELEKASAEAESVVLPPISISGGAGAGGGSAGGSGKGKKAGGGGKGRVGREERPFFENIEKDLLNLERQMQLIGKTSEEVATMQTRWELLDEAKKRGIPVNETLNAQIDAQAAQVGRLTGELERAEISQQQFDQAIDGVADAMAGALVAGESLREGLAQVFKQIASDIINSGIRNALSSVLSPQGGGGGFGGFMSGLFGGGKGGLFSFAGGGFTGNGARSGGLDGEGGFPAILHPRETVIDHTRGQRAGGGSMSVTIDLRGTTGDRALDQKIRAAGAQVLQQAKAQTPGWMSDYDKRAR